MLFVLRIDKMGAFIVAWSILKKGGGTMEVSTMNTKGQVTIPAKCPQKNNLFNL